MQKLKYQKATHLFFKLGYNVGVCAVGDLRAQNYRDTPKHKRSYKAANYDKTPIAYNTVLGGRYLF